MKSSYKGTWLLLAAAFVLLLVVSAADGRVQLAGYTPKASSLYDSLFGHHAGDAPAEPDAPAPGDTLQTAKAVEPDTLPKTILFIGDSMLEGLSPRLAAYCAASDHTLYTVIWYSSTSEQWGSSSRLSEYIGRIKPDYIFICLGANELFVRNIEEKRTRFVRKMVSDIDTIPYIWIGPPNWKEDTGINRMVERNTAAGSFFLSDGMTFERKADGAHPTAASARQWMDSVVRWMPGHAAHPILMRTPEQTSGRPARVFIHQPNQ